MTDLKIFKNTEFGRVRLVLINGEPWIVGKDVAEALGYERTADAIRTHVDDEDKGVGEIQTPGGTQKMTIINESGMYALIFGSKLPSARRFKHWVTSEVLPAIRKTGGYIHPNVYKIKDTSLGEITSFVREMDKVMRDQNSHPSDIAEAFKGICEQFGIQLPQDFVREPVAVEPIHFLPLDAFEKDIEID